MDHRSHAHGRLLLLLLLRSPAVLCFCLEVPRWLPLLQHHGGGGLGMAGQVVQRQRHGWHCHGGCRCRRRASCRADGRGSPWRRGIEKVSPRRGLTPDWARLVLLLVVLRLRWSPVFGAALGAGSHEGLGVTLRPANPLLLWLARGDPDLEGGVLPGVLELVLLVRCRRGSADALLPLDGVGGLIGLAARSCGGGLLRRGPLASAGHRRRLGPRRGVPGVGCAPFEVDVSLGNVGLDRGEVSD